MNRVYEKPKTLTDILIKDVLRIDALVDNKSEELIVGTPVVLIDDAWEKATTSNIESALKCGILLENATSKATYTIMLIGVVSFCNVDDEIKKAFLKSNLIYL